MTQESPVSTAVSCIIPTHGRPEYLAEAVRSVLAQQSLPGEVIIVSDDDNGATAAVIEDLARFATVPVIFVRRTTGAPGASASRNLGARTATGSLLAFLDDDDLWEPGYLTLALKRLAERATDAVVTSFYRFTDSERSGETRPPEALTPRDAFIKSPGVTGSTLLISREAFENLGGYDDSLPVMNDTDFFLRFLLAERSYAVCDELLVGVRKHGDGQLTDNSPRRVAGGWVFLAKHRGSFDRGAARPRLYWQYRMLWRIPGAGPVSKARALLGMAWYHSASMDAPTGSTTSRIRNRADLHEFFAADLVAQNASGMSRLRQRTKPTIRFLRALRVAEYYRRPGASGLSRVLRVVANRRLSRLAVLTGISIPPGAFGKGLGLPHYGSIVVHTKARFGDWCCIQNNVNIGVSAGGIPRGGDFIYIAPGAVIYGDITIGSRSVIGANSVVGRDVEPGTTWAGAPARKISDTDSTNQMVAGVAALMRAADQEIADQAR
ncbi:glycosyltransferase [Herbiconiux sp. KACC 21604]|uniref:glycosyltransferase n=1 Tax=unclassified Herbiconiux TaxID=2618217 RepID=UPI0014911903|nr:glycosyltransferase [Herbiconiux sp. SALV-R1]QJU54581.1 glycosyltransferase [Herbiconiux sp. SALV-R1]WPO85667.1 glycosyltransferase [Herbiconiux sp. KACC 21604]